MSELERRKKQLELSRVKLAKEELDLKILERKEEIARMEQAIVVQDKRIAELEVELAN